MSRPAKIVVVGSANMDLVVRAEHIPSPGETVLGGEFAIIPGGKGANQAVAAARVGGEVTFVGRVGTDAFGGLLRAELEHAGVGTHTLKSDSEAPSGVALIGVSQAGENAIMVAPGANGRVCETDILEAESVIAEADWLIVQLEIPLEAALCAMKIAQKYATQVLLNPAPAQPLPHSFLKWADVITPNEHEALALLGRKAKGDEDMQSVAEELAELGIGTVIITLGAKGCVAVRKNEKHSIPAPEVKAIDTTAAGDCFSGTLAVAMGEGMNLEEATVFALHAASLSVTRRGAQPSLPTRAELVAFLAPN